MVVKHFLTKRIAGHQLPPTRQSAKRPLPFRMRRSLLLPTCVVSSVMLIAALSAAMSSPTDAVAQPASSTETNVPGPLPTIVVPTIPAQSPCEGAPVGPWPDMPDDGWIGDFTEYDPPLHVGENLSTDRVSLKIEAALVAALGGDAADTSLQRRSLVSCSADNSSGVLIESHRSRVDNVDGEQAIFIVGQLVHQLSLDGFPRIGERATSTAANGAVVLTADAGHRVEVIVIHPSGRIIWGVVKGANSPSFSGFPTTPPPLPDRPDPEPSPLEVAEVVDLALELGRTTPCGKASPVHNVVVSDAGRLLGTAGRDYLCGGASQNVISGFTGRDVLRGGAGIDVLLGGRGADKLYGGRGEDSLFGGRGKDRLWGGPGFDRCSDKVRAISCE